MLYQISMVSTHHCFLDLHGNNNLLVKKLNTLFFFYILQKNFPFKKNI